MSYSRHINKTVELVKKIFCNYDYNLDIQLHRIKIEVNTDHLDEVFYVLDNQLKQYYLFSCIDKAEKKLNIFIRSFI